MSKLSLITMVAGMLIADVDASRVKIYTGARGGGKRHRKEDVAAQTAAQVKRDRKNQKRLRDEQRT